MHLGAYPRGITLARSFHNPALRVSVLRVYKAAKRRILAAHAGRALPKGRRTWRRRTRIVCADALVASAAGFSCVRLVAVIRHVPLAPRIAFAALAVTSEKCCIGNVGQGVIVVGRDNFSWLALVASAAGLLCRFALAILFDLVFAPRRTITGRHADVGELSLVSLSQTRPHAPARRAAPASTRQELLRDYHPRLTLAHCRAERGTEPSSERWNPLTHVRNTDGNNKLESRCLNTPTHS